MLLLFQMNISAWDDTGHMVVAYIAYTHLDPSVKLKVNKLLLPSAENGGKSWIQLCGRKYNPVTIANWMDDLRGIAKPAPFAEWHYINFNPLFTADFPATIQKDQIKPAETNVLTQIVWAIKQLQSARKFDKTIKTKDDETSAYALAYLIHLVGDVHQPLHCTTRYSKKYPGGDFGGNLFSIKSPETYNSLHAFWDGAGGLFDFESIERPADNSIPPEIASLAKEVTDKVPATNSEWKNATEPEKWVEESNSIAREFAFNPQFIADNEDKAPSQDYINKAQEKARMRLAFAGYRLAETINRIYTAP
jgi:hypothetical protein